MSESSKKNQLHALLAVENDRKTRGNKILEEAVTTFTKKQDHFDGVRKSYVAREEGGIEPPMETKEIVTTVAAKVNYAKDAIIRGIDAQVSKEETNNGGEAKAMLSVDGTEIGELSATSLLALESWAIKVRSMYDAIPTLDPARVWNVDTNNNNTFITNEEIKQRTGKRNHPIVMYEATEKHPAQVQMGTEDIVLGEVKTIYSSGKITPADKSKLLNRIDMIIDRIKKAKSKANQAEVVKRPVGAKLFDFINEGIL
jgi:hypothetical protein